MPLVDESTGAFEGVSNNAIEILRRSEIILTDLPAPSQWTTPQRAVWIDDVELRGCLTTTDLEFLVGDKVLVSSDVKSNAENRGRAGHFFGRSGLDLQTFGRPNVIDALRNQAWLDSKEDDIAWFERLFAYLSDGKGLSDTVVQRLSSGRMIPTADAERLARPNDVFLAADNSIVFSEASFVHGTLCGNAKLRKFLASRFRIPEGTYENLIGRIVVPRSRNEENRDRALLEYVRLVKAYWESRRSSQTYDLRLLADLQNYLKLQAKDGTWHHAQRLHIVDTPQENALSHPIFVPPRRRRAVLAGILRLVKGAYTTNPVQTL